MMKQKPHLLAMLFVATAMTLGLAACQDDEPEQPAPEQPATLNLTNTTWEALAENTFVMQQQGYNFEIHVSMNAIMDILDGENCELFIDVSIEVPAAPAANQNMTQTEPCTYTFDGTSLVLTSKGEDAAEGDNGTMTYDAASNTFTMPIDEPEVEEMLGAHVLVFHLTRGGQL